MGLPRFSSAPSSPVYEHLDLDPEHTPGIHLLTRPTFLKPLHLVSPILLVLLLAYVAWHRNDANTVYVDRTTGFVNSVCTSARAAVRCSWLTTAIGHARALPSRPGTLRHRVPESVPVRTRSLPPRDAHPARRVTVPDQHETDWRAREIDRAKKYWMPRGGVSLADLDAAELQGQARAMIYKGRVRNRSHHTSSTSRLTSICFAGRVDVGDI